MKKSNEKLGVRALAKAAALALALAFAGCTPRVETWLDGQLASRHEFGDGKWELVASERIERGDLCTITIVCRRRKEAR